MTFREIQTWTKKRIVAATFVRTLSITEAAKAAGISLTVAEKYLEDPDVVDELERMIAERMRRLRISSDKALADVYDAAQAAVAAKQFYAAGDLFKLVFQHMGMLPSAGGGPSNVINFSFGADQTPAIEASCVQSLPGDTYDTNALPANGEPELVQVPELVEPAS